ncbi:MAG: MerR family transcriptional regulator [Clostridia bacterium]|nr:MerR family transcriptional regulator [Clostridia bacterium]
MKMKDVLMQTSLTDRAVRLYIDSGLVAPNIEQSLSGRKNIEFSAEDVERLKNIALMRESDFSIAEIKSIIENPGTSKQIVENYIKRTNENIVNKTAIIEKLRTISDNDEITFESICKTLLSTADKRQLPIEDLYLPPKEKAKKYAFIAFSCFQATVALLAFITVCVLICDYRYPRVSLSDIMFLLLNIGWLVIIALSAVVIRFNTGRFVFVTERSRLKHLSFFLCCVTVACGFFSFFASLLCAIVQPVYSQTEELNNYLILDERLERYLRDEAIGSSSLGKTYLDYAEVLGDIGMEEYFKYKETEALKLTDVFPDEVPESASWVDGGDYPDTTNYFYRHTCDNDYYYESYDIFAEWVLPSEEYEAAKEAMPESAYCEQKGNWTCLYYERSIKPFSIGEDEFTVGNWDGAIYSLFLAAYNDQTQTVRYIASACCGHNPPEQGPYYISLEW